MVNRGGGGRGRAALKLQDRTEMLMSKEAESPAQPREFRKRARWIS